MAVHALRRRVARALSVAVAVGVVVAGQLPADAALASGEFVHTGRLMKRWVATNGAKDQTVTQAQAEAIARRTEVLVARERAFKPYLAAMRVVNPGVKVLVYLNGAFSGKDRTFPENFYAHDKDGNRIFSTKWDRWMMDVGNNSWSASVAQECTDDIAWTGYDGCYVDMLGTAPLLDGYVSTKPINPATGAVWTADEYVAATSAIGANAERTNGGHIVVGNGLSNGKKYYALSGATAPLLNGLDGGNAEGWIRGANQGITQFRREGEWRKDVDMLADAGRRGSSVLAMTKVWVSGTPEQIERWHKYAFASFLLGTDGRSYFSFYADPAGQSMVEASTPHRWDGVDLGAPSGAYFKKTGVYRRDFSNGISLVNPTTATVTVNLGRSYIDLAGTARTSVTLTANTAEVLRVTA